MTLQFKLLIDYYVGGGLHVVLKPLVVVAGKILHRDHDLKRCPTVTVVKMMGGGSLVVAYPALLALKGAPSVGKLQLVATPAVAPFAEVLGIFDRIVVIRESSLTHFFFDSLRAMRELFRCDAMLDLEVHSRLTTVFSLFTCARNRVGFYTRDSFWRKWLATHLLFFNTHSGVFRFYDQTAALFGAAEVSAAQGRAAFRAHLGLASGPRTGGPARLALAPCCSGLSTERMLTPAEWVEILGRREPPIRSGTELHLLGAPADRAPLEELAGMIRTRFPGLVVFNRAGETTLEESVRLLAESDELLSIDSALLHFARLLGVPTMSFWGPTDPAIQLRPTDGDSHAIHYRKLPCSPCVHIAQEAPCKGNNVCMRLAANPDFPTDLNPPWMVGVDSVSRFARPAAP